MRRSGRGNLGARRRLRQGGAWGLALAGLLAAGCAGAEGGAGAEPPAAPPADTTAPPLPGADRPEVVEGVLNLEGMREPMTYRLYRSPEGYPLPFSTYLPADVRADELSSDEAQAVRFVAAFGGVPNEEIYLSVHFPQERLGMERARARAREIAGSLGRAEPGERERFPWALEWHRVAGEGGRVASVALARHLDRYFFVVLHYPAEAAEGFGPRAGRILDEWRWLDGGALGT